MKKIYMQPETLVEGMELEEMIASTTLLGGGSQNLNSAPETEAQIGNLVREMTWLLDD